MKKMKSKKVKPIEVEKVEPEIVRTEDEDGKAVRPILPPKK